MIMHTKLKKSSLLILVVTAVVFARGMFTFIDDPEGPNLLVVMGTALVVYLISLVISLPFLSTADSKSVIPVVLIQMGVVAGLYFLLQL